MTQKITDRIVCEQWWPTNIYFKDVANYKEINKELKKNILEWKDKDKGIVRSNKNGWHSPGDMNKRPKYKIICDEIIKVANSIAKNEGYNFNSNHIDIDNMWANVNPKYSYNKCHTHPNSFFSGVYYVQVPKNSGNICFYDPRTENERMAPVYDKDKKPLKQCREIGYDALEGRLIMFPAWLAHDVDINLTDDKDDNRISISFNIKQYKN